MCAREGIDDQDYVVIDAQRVLDPVGGDLLQVEEGDDCLCADLLAQHDYMCIGYFLLVFLNRANCSVG